MKFTFDTNVLVYATDVDASEKHTIAADLITRATKADCVLILQSLSEFFNVAMRQARLELADAVGFVEDWGSVFPVVAADKRTLLIAMDAVRHHMIPLWDAMLWATARQAGCHLLLTEDFQDGRTLEGVTFVNPFLPHNETLISTVLASPAGEP
ncbi:MAG: PIN domain-containing protein [Rhodospirillales bacterium]|nr:PIN domain-containing protein [Rhodospirillales bacterium]